jgi:hypothetical protein
VQYGHTVLDVSWNWHARIIAGLPARVKKSTLPGTRRMNESEPNIRIPVDAPKPGQSIPGCRWRELADRVSSPPGGDDGRTEDRGGASGQRVPRRSPEARQVHMALTAARKIGYPIYPTVLPDAKLSRARFEPYPSLPEDD